MAKDKACPFPAARSRSGPEPNPETIATERTRLLDLQHEVLGVKVPLSYSDEIYDLHLHIDSVIHRLNRAKNDLSASPG